MMNKRAKRAGQTESWRRRGLVQSCKTLATLCTPQNKTNWNPTRNASDYTVGVKRKIHDNGNDDNYDDDDDDDVLHHRWAYYGIFTHWRTIKNTA